MAGWRPHKVSSARKLNVGSLCLKSRTPRLDRVSTGSGSDLVNERSQESLGMSHADH